MTDDPATQFPANADQAAYWNASAGAEWVALQAELDQRFRLLTDELIARAAIVSGERALDIGCGTGATTLALAERVGPDGSVLALDISEPMLALARRRCAERHYDHVRFVHADAQTHRFESAGRDLLMSRLGVMFFADPVAAFANLKGALRPGGRIAFVCGGPLERNPWVALPLAVGVRHLGPSTPQPPRAPGPLALSEPDYIEEILNAAGFAAVAIDTASIEILGAADAAAEALFACLVGPLARLIRERSADAALQHAMVGEITADFAPYQTGAGVRIPATLHYVTAIRP
jgi:SAM-dependent methyltransferase